MPSIRSSTFTSSYTSGTLSIAAPSGMQPGDLLVVYLIALGVHWGFYQVSGSTVQDFGNAPTGRAPAHGVGSSGGLWPPGGPALSDYAHTPPITLLAQGTGGDLWTDTAGGKGYYGNFWSNLGHRDATATGSEFDTPENAAVLVRWPFIDCLVAERLDTPFTPDKSNSVASLTMVGRPVDGSELSSYSFTLNNPLDAEYDYRAIALCFEPNDWSGDYYDVLSLGGTGAKSLNNRGGGWWPATGARGAPVDNLSTVKVASSGATSAYNGSDGYVLPPFTWPLRTSDLPFLADPSSGQQNLATPPLDLNTTNDLLLHFVCYGGPTSYGDPSTISVADLSATTHVDPLPVLHQEVWTKSSSTLMVQLTQTHVTTDHPTDTAFHWPGSGQVHLTARVFTADGGPIAAPYPTPIAPFSSTEVVLGFALTFRVRAPVSVARRGQAFVIG